MSKMTNFERFLYTYAVNLNHAVAEHPREYRSSAEVTLRVLEMSTALRLGLYSKDACQIANTCKDLGVAHTYAAINAYLSDR